MQLSEIIIQKIKDQGPVSFRDFMEMALYYPELGYYTSARNKIGTDGDYYTSPDLTPLFGEMIGKQLEQMSYILGEEQPFIIVEYGAGKGHLCHDILDYLKGNERLYEHLHYCIIEKSPAMQNRERTHLHEKVRWYNSILELPEVSGCILSNELVDNFPVHQVIMQDELMEVFVDYQDGFIELYRPATQDLIDYLAELNITLEQGFRTEINLQASQWIKSIAMSLKKGFVLTIDYGDSSSALYSRSRSCGTLVCYNNHRINNALYDDIGQQDITSHVNFSALCHWGLKEGLECCGLTNQANFLLALGFGDQPPNQQTDGQSLMKMVQQQAFLTHTLLVDMGRKYKVLIQKKGVGKHDLLGLRFS